VGGLVTSKQDEAEGEPHVARGGREHGREGRAKDAAEYVGSVGELVLSSSIHTKNKKMILPPTL
jgi:hypothetical protein